MIDITGYPLIPLKKDDQGKYPYLRERYGVLPYYIDSEGQIFWGCVESNRVGPTVLAPAAGSQDIIAIKDTQRIVLESGKPLPDIPMTQSLELNGKRFRDEVYQQLIEHLFTQGFQVYFESPLATAIHETYEEHGLNLTQKGHDVNFLQSPLVTARELAIPRNQNIALLHLWVVELVNHHHVVLQHTEKVDEKITEM